MSINYKCTTIDFRYKFGCISARIKYKLNYKEKKINYLFTKCFMNFRNISKENLLNTYARKIAEETMKNRIDLNISIIRFL